LSGCRKIPFVFIDGQISADRKRPSSLGKIKLNICEEKLEQRAVSEVSEN